MNRSLGTIGPDLATHRFRMPIALLLLLATITCVVATPSFANLDALVKLPIVIVFGLTALAIMTYRPVVFPLALYLFMVPFDGLLQTGGGTLTKFLAAASMGVILLVLVDRRRWVPPPMVVALWALFLCWNVASFMWSEDPWFRVVFLTATAQLFALFAICSVVRVRWGEVKALLFAVLGGGVACAGYGIYLFQKGSIQSNTASQRLDVALSNTQSINADHFSAALIFPIAIAIVAALELRGWRKIVAAACALILLAAICASGTRGSLFGVAGIWLYLIVAFRHRLQLGLLALLGLASTAFVPTIWARFSDPSQGEAGGRYSIWKVGWEYFKHHWLLGVGTEQFQLAYADAYLSMPGGDRIIHSWYSDPHNLIVSTGVELGTVGLILTLAAWYWQFRVGAEIPRTAAQFPARIAVQAGILGLFINAMSLDIMFYKYLWVAFILSSMVRNAWLTEREPVAAPAVVASSSEPAEPVVVPRPLHALQT